MKSCSKKILIDMIKPKKNTMHLLCRLTPDGHYTNTYFFKGGFAVRVWL